MSGLPRLEMRSKRGRKEKKHDPLQDFKMTKNLYKKFPENSEGENQMLTVVKISTI
jgi:hypothetical protein